MFNIVLKGLKDGSVVYTNKVEKILDNGFLEISSKEEAIPLEDGSYICDCGDWVNNNNFHHKVIDWKTRYEVTWCPVCELQRYVSIIYDDPLNYWCDCCNTIFIKEEYKYERKKNKSKN